MSKICGQTTKKGCRCQNKISLSSSLTACHIHRRMGKKRLAELPKAPGPTDRATSPGKIDSSTLKVLTYQGHVLNDTERTSITRIITRDCFPNDDVNASFIFRHETSNNFRSFLLSDQAGNAQSYLTLESTQRNVYKLWNVCTGKRARKNGYLRRLLEYAQSKSIGWSKIELDVYASNNDGISVYKRLGFTQTKLRNGIVSMVLTAKR